MGPVKADEFFLFAFQNFRIFFGTVPGERKNPILVIHLVGKPLLQA
jgi:hypothetical protein